MRQTGYLVLALLAGAAIPGAPALANTCVAGKMTCATTMPVDGYCECTGHGQTEGGTVVSRVSGHRGANAAAGGCGSHPDAPGCR